MSILPKFMFEEVNTNTIGGATVASLQNLLPDTWTKAHEEETIKFAVEVRKALDSGDFAVVDLKTGRHVMSGECSCAVYDRAGVCDHTDE